jgi:hypothetical protein
MEGYFGLMCQTGQKEKLHAWKTVNGPIGDSEPPQVFSET